MNLTAQVYMVANKTYLFSISKKLKLFEWIARISAQTIKWILIFKKLAVNIFISQTDIKMPCLSMAVIKEANFLQINRVCSYFLRI